MIKELPTDSPIIIDTIDGQKRITIPFDRNIRKLIIDFLVQFILIGGFLLMFWSCLVAIQIHGSDFFYNTGLTISLLMLIYQFWVLYCLARKSSPDYFYFNKTVLIYRNGIPPLHLLDRAYENMVRFRILFLKQKTHEFSLDEIKKIQLTEGVFGNRLSIKNIDIATAASEVEREWLHKIIKQQYITTDTKNNEIN
ncbi:PH domain-containing protein [Kiloniella majae]|uniref:PH domain-containing protein n=1 Tax=Kiloniella majae TaxID=1938558 RepID=UPI000A278A45|nr:PH domain-containing protein [Kiloniella majae]